MKIALVIGSLIGGGAEKQFSTLAYGLTNRGHDVELLTLSNHDSCNDSHFRVENLLDDQGLISRKLRLLNRAHNRIITLAKSGNYDVMYSALHLTNYVAAKNANSFPCPVVCGIRASGVDRCIARYYRFLSMRHLDKVRMLISNSVAGLQELKDSFPNNYFPPSVVISNGIDSAKFSYTETGRIEIRESLGISKNEPVVLMVGRKAPMKDHKTMLGGFSVFKHQFPSAHLVLVGKEIPLLKGMVHQHQLNSSVHLIEFSEALSDYYSAADVVALSSKRAEGWPNVIGEAMACKRAVVATDVGDSKAIVGNCGIVVHSQDCEALGGALIEAFKNRIELSKNARTRVRSEYSVSSMVEKTEEVLLQVSANQ